MGQQIFGFFAGIALLILLLWPGFVFPWLFW